MNVPLSIFVGVQQIDRQNSQSVNNHTFYRPPVPGAKCIIGTEEYPDAGILLNYNDDDCFGLYHQIKEAFRALTRDDILQTYIPDHDLRS